MSEKRITIGIPVYKAHKYICDALASIYIQTIRDQLKIILAKDLPGEDYSFILERFPELDIEILDCKKNTGPGLARQRIIDACETEWITFLDSDDVFFGPAVLEAALIEADKDPTCVEMMCSFYEEIIFKTANPEDKLAKKFDVWQPWVFSRLFRTAFLKNNNIRFSDLRIGEDSEFCWKILILAEGTNFKVSTLDVPMILWRKGSDTSLTRQTIKGRKNPHFNYDLSAWAVAEAVKRVMESAKEHNKPWTKNHTLLCAAALIRAYINYCFSIIDYPEFVEQNLWCGKKAYHDLREYIDDRIDDSLITKLGEQNNEASFNYIKDKLGEEGPSVQEFLDRIRTEPYGGMEEFWEIRKKLPKEIIKSDKKTKLIDCVPKK